MIALDRLFSEWVPDLNFLVLSNGNALSDVGSALNLGSVENIAVLAPYVVAPPLIGNLPFIFDLSAPEIVTNNDVVVINPQLGTLRVMYRDMNKHHAVALTNRCNSRCVMCSQPPTEHQDDWMVEDARAVARHLRSAPETIGLTGGEPLLLGADLRAVIDEFAQRGPETRIDVLTNGRLFADKALATAILSNLTANVQWNIPLYGHVDYLHDFIVQRQGAFDQTINGLLSLHHHRQVVELRVVLLVPVLEHLRALCEFIALNLPFVSHVALMGVEPTGYARANRDLCEVDLSSWGSVLEESVLLLEHRGVRCILMNAPLCLIPKTLWRVARQSISEWKNDYHKTCDGCSVMNECSGLFSSHKQGWLPGAIRPIVRKVNVEFQEN